MCSRRFMSTIVHSRPSNCVFFRLRSRPFRHHVDGLLLCQLEQRLAALATTRLWWWSLCSIIAVVYLSHLSVSLLPPPLPVFNLAQHAKQERGTYHTVVFSCPTSCSED
ncbi:hypothetical protein MUK42_07387, partial [Musa troglodytarum]